jgi:hypothetical protein
MGGIKTAGDMVLRMQLTRGMRIDAAKAYVAGKLGVTIAELCDCSTMAEIRRERGLGVQMPGVDDYTGMEAKLRIAELLNIRINSVERFKRRNGLK